MGCYTWLSDSEFELYSRVDDIDINSVLQEVRRIDAGWYISERKWERKRFLRKPVEDTTYQIYQQTLKPEVRCQMSAHTKRDVLNFLYGLNVGLHHKQTMITI